MMKFWYSPLAVTVLSCATLFAQYTGSAQADTTKAEKHERASGQGDQVSAERAQVDQRLRDSSRALAEVTRVPARGIPEAVLANAKCVATVPELVKGGFDYSGQYGRGVATCRTANAWSTPAFFTITGGVWDAQIGVEAAQLIMLFTDQEGMNKFLDGQLDLGTDASVAGGPIGSETRGKPYYKTPNSQVLAYLRAKGAFLGVSLNGASVRPDDDANKAFYGSDYDFRSLLAGEVRPPSAANQFLAGVRRDFREAVAQH
jgi:lipid-binding SYLF domain-containing protein